MTETTDTENSESTESESVNISRLREMAIRGTEYRESLEIEDYYDMSGTLYCMPLPDEKFLPIAAFLEDRLDIDHEEAQEKLEDAEEEDGSIDPSNFDEEFVGIMQRAAALGIDREQGLAEGEDLEGVKEILSMLQGGLTLIIAEKVLSMTSDAGKAESFRRDGGSE